MVLAAALAAHVEVDAVGAEEVGVGALAAELDLRLALDALPLGARLGLRGRHAGRLDRVVGRLDAVEVLPDALRLGLPADRLPLELPARDLLEARRVVARLGLLRLGRDLDGELDGLLEAVARLGVGRLDGLDVDVGDDEVVRRELERVADLAVVVAAEDGGADDAGAVAPTPETATGATASEISSEDDTVPLAIGAGAGTTALAETEVETSLQSASRS